MAGLAGQPGTKPSQLDNPVPGQQDEADALLSSFDAADDLLNSFDTSAAPPIEAPPPEDPGMVSQALDYTGRALDYAGGLTRTGLASVASVAQHATQGELGNDVTPEDVSAALQGKAPTSSEYLRRLGVGEMGSINAFGAQITGRGLVGFAADVATDPLTMVIKTVKKLPYLRKLINAEGKTGLANKATEALGEAVYKSALPEGAQDAAEALLKQGDLPVGGAAKIAKHVENAAKTMGDIRQGLYDRATELGVTIDTAYPLKRAEAVLTKMERDPALRGSAQQLRDMLNAYKAEGKVGLDLMSEWKTNLYDALPESAFRNGRLRGQAKQFKMALAADFREAIIGAGEAAEKGLGKSIDSLNDTWGAFLSATRPLEKAAKSPGSKLGLMIDGAVAASGGPQAYAVKKGFDMATGTTARTIVGNALIKAGQNDLASRLARQTAAKLAKDQGQK